MHTTTFAVSLAALFSGVSQAKYTLGTTYDSTNFFDEFDFFTASDPTHGFVDYVDQGTATSEGLASYSHGGVYMGVDSKTQGPANGRKSVRVTSKASFTHGLFIADIAHMPGSICGAWPAYWLVGPDWPNSGEIDIIEGVNAQIANDMTLHTSATCTINNKGSDPNTQLLGSDCNAGSAHDGCGQVSADVTSYGDGFNDHKGGVYATEWTSDYIAVWFFSRSKIPGDISSGNPDPSKWGSPMAKFNGGSGCDIDGHFKNNQIVFDTTFCGDWAGAVFGSDPECSALAPTCNDYVSGNPGAFAEAYWVVNSVKVYNQ